MKHKKNSSHLKQLFLLFFSCLQLSIPSIATDLAQKELELENHQVWWGKNFNDPYWLGGIQMASRASMRQQVKAKGYTSVLDTPCAYCIDFDGLQAEGLSVKYYGVDITKKMTDACSARGIDARQGSIEQIPLEDSSVDLAYSRHILEHLPYYENAIKDLVRVARQEVYIVFFIKPTYSPENIHQDLVNGDLLYHNRYDRGKLERFIYSLDKVDHIEWEQIDNVEEILHIYLKQLPENASAPELINCPVKPVDFDKSLGKGQITIGEDGLAYDLFNDCLYTEKENQKYAGIWDWATKPKSPFEFYSFLKKLYEKNAPWVIKPSQSYKIPRHIHQIWIQGEMPEQYKKWQQTWQELMPGWNYTLWTDKEIRKLPLKNRALYEQATNYGEKSDIARYEILNLFGGMYIDTDFECLNPEIFDYLNRCYTFYTGLAPLDCAHLVCANGLIASAPGHPILKEMIASLSGSYDEHTPVHLRAGPIPFTKVVWRCADQAGYDDIIFPPSYFYPVGMLNVVGGSYTTPAHYYQLIKPESIALHYWGRSWSSAPRYYPEASSAAEESSPEDYQKTDKQFVIIVTAHKAKHWYKRNLDSVKAQTYSNWELIYIADGDDSSDGTGDAVQEYIKENNLESKITLVCNSTRKDKLCNIYDTIQQCDKHKIIVMLDYDDWLYDNNVLDYLNQVYKKPYKGNQVWLTYGQYAFWPNGAAAGLTSDEGLCREIPEDIVNSNGFRNYEFVSSHLKTFYAGLFHKIKREDLVWKESLFIPYIDDVAYMMCLLELAGHHSRFIPKTLYVYNAESNSNHLNAWLTATLDDRTYLYEFIKNTPRYTPIASPF